MRVLANENVSGTVSVVTDDRIRMRPLGQRAGDGPA